MILSRLLRIQIYNAQGIIEYDSKTDTNWGITAGSASLDELIMDEELRFGDVNSSIFQVQVFNISEDISKRKIVVIAEDKVEVRDYLVDESGNHIVDEDGNNISGVTGQTDISTTLFTGWIDSAKRDNSGTYRDIIAYDWLYYHRQDNVASWWNSYWTNNQTSTLKALRTSLLNYMGITTAIPNNILNDGLSIKNNYQTTMTAISFETVLQMICILQNCSPHINGDGVFELIKLSSNLIDVTNNVEGENCIYEDYITNPITGIAVYDTNNNLVQVVGTDTNVYKIVGNLFLLDMTATQLTNVCTAILNELSTVQYIPSSISLIMSNLNYKVGNYIHTVKGNSYVFRLHLYGNLLVDETLDSYALGANLNADVYSLNESLLEGNKIARVEKNIDGLSTQFSAMSRNLQDNYLTKTQTESAIQQSADEIETNVSNTYVTQADYTAQIANLQDQIDGRIETFEGTVVPTLNNYPAVDWTTTALKDQHIGDLYKYKHQVSGVDTVDMYRFDKDSNGVYSWILLGASEVDEALRQAAIANQKADAAQTQLDALEQTIQDDYATKSELSSSINQSASAIETSVSQTYETKSDATSKQNNLQGQITTNQTNISQLSNQIVMKATSGGKIVTVALSADASTGSEFKVKADNIAFIADGTIELTSNNLAINSTNFKVTKAGAITSTSGTIGGFSIGAKSLQSTYTNGANRNNLLIQAWDGTDTNRIAYCVRTSTDSGSTWTYPFIVRWNGTLETTNIRATGGKIGGFSIGANTLGALSANSLNQLLLQNISDNNVNAIAYCIRTRTSTSADWTYPFIVRWSGALTATNANITGTINTSALTATGGTIGGWSIKNNKLYSSTYGETIGTQLTPSDIRVCYQGSGTRPYKVVTIDGAGITLAEYSSTTGATFQINAILNYQGLTIPFGYVHAGGYIQADGGLELYHATPFIDFHLDSSTADFTYRVIHRTADTLDFVGHNSSTWGTLKAKAFSVQSSRNVKTNIKDIADEEAKKLLELRPVSFDYINGDTNNRGLIAEEVLDIMPDMVQVPEGYTEFNPDEPWNTPSIDYSKFVPYLIKMIQMQQSEIEQLKSSIK